MKLAVSNIAWTPEQDEQVYELLKRYGYTGLEIAPTRIFPDRPYDRLEEATRWAGNLKSAYGLLVPSMQSIWYGMREKIFGSAEEREILLGYTRKAVDFAESIGCRYLVFGCPKNRVVPDSVSSEEADRTAVTFFREIGDYAAVKGIVIGMEANPEIYGTNFINWTSEALRLIRQVNSEGFRLNLDVGTMVQNGEHVEELAGSADLISHVHVSEPGLGPVKERSLHRQLFDLLKAEGYEGYVSIEMGRQEDISEIERVMRYVKGIFGER